MKVSKYRDSKAAIRAVVFVCIIALVMLLNVSCSSRSFVGEDRYLLSAVEIKSEDRGVNVSQLSSAIRQRPNTKWFSAFKIPMGIYCMSGADTTKWLNRTLRNFGEAPVVYDSMKSVASCRDMTTILRAMGYIDADVSCVATRSGCKLKVTYNVRPGQPYRIDSIHYNIEDRALLPVLYSSPSGVQCIKRGDIFSADVLGGERKRISQILQDNGYYKFNKDFIYYDVDTTSRKGYVDVDLNLVKYRRSNNSPETPHQRYHINNVRYHGVGGARVPLRQSVLLNNTALRTGRPYRVSDLQDTYNSFARLGAVRFTNISFSELPDTALLDCDITVGMHNPNSFSFQPEGTNTAGNLGAALSVTYSNNNLFHGSELFSLQVRGAYEAITGLEGYQRKDYKEYNIEGKIAFPRLLVPPFIKSFKRRNTTLSELSFGYNMQNRPEFHRRVLSSAWRYRWNSASRRNSYSFDLVDINYVIMPWISPTFKEEYLDNASNRNAILRYNYEDIFILKTGLTVSINDGRNAIRASIECAGNLLNGIAHLTNTRKNDNGQYTIFNIAYAQYVKGDFHYTHVMPIDYRNSIAMHAGLGVAIPYANSYVLPFEKRYFSGGANSVRGWNVRELGPGRFRGTDGRIDFINQTGDIKLDLNMELRTSLFWKFNGAFFIDAGNIWTVRDYKDQEGGQFKFDEFYKQIAVSYGLGLRLNLDYFILRLDCGMKAINPVYTTSKEHYCLLSPKMSRDMAVHFAVGMPF